MTFLTNLSDLVLVWLHGRRLGLTGDGQSSGTSLLVLDGVAVGSSRSGTAPVLSLITSGAGVGSLVLAGAVVGDSVQKVFDTSAWTDVSADFEATISVAGHLQQSVSTSSHVVMVVLQPQS